MKSKKIGFFKSIGGKILLIFIVVSILALGTIAVISAIASARAVKAATSNQLESIGVIKANQIINLFDRLISDTEVVADSQDVINSVEKLIVYHREMDIKGTDSYNMSSSADSLTLTYDEIYNGVNSVLKKYAEVYGYYDVFLVCAAHGHVMYTWAKEADLGENLSVGQYKDSGLAEVWRKALSEKEAVLVDISAYAPSDGAPAMFAGAPIRKGNETLGVFVIQVPSDQINDVVHERTGMGETGETYLIGTDKERTTSLRSDRVLKDGKILDIKNDLIITKCLDQGMSGVEIKTGSTGDQELVAYLPVELPDGIRWGILSTMAMDEINKPVSTLINLIIIVTIVTLIIVLVIALSFSRTISKPMANLTNLASEIGIGNFNVIIDEKLLRAKDEIGALSNSFDSMIESLQYKGNMVEEVAKGNLTIDVKLASDKDVLGVSLIQMTDSLNNLLGNVNMSVGQVNIGADQVSQASQSLSQGATESASSMEEVSASITQVNSQSQQNAENATEANGLAKQATEDAAQGNKEMEGLSVAMKKINDSSDQIKKIVKVIDDIAFQTNLLALNANVEAARAGKYGKGFAVVADEVRNLAVRSAEAVKETTDMVDESIKNIDSGNDAVAATATQLASIMEGSSRVADFLEEIATASMEQAEAIDQITQGLEQIDQVTQSNTASAEESAAAAEELASQSVQLKNMVATFKLKNTQNTVGTEPTRQLEYQAKKESVQHPHAAVKQGKTGIKPVDPITVISLDDDDFDRF
jgi:methyl-accepting chemotaxis protein